MIKRFLASFVVAVGLLVASPVAVLAASGGGPNSAECQNGVADFLFLKSWDACLEHDANGVPQITSLNKIWVIVLTLLEDGFKAGGYVAAGFLIWGGIKYLKSQGDPGQLTEARQVIYNALFGLLLLLISVAIVNFVAGAFNG